MKSRNREINIFNMSLLDILCGALGAFCFMMIVLLPYYKPENPDDLKKQKDLDQTMKDLDKLKEKLADAKLAKELEELIKKLQEQIKELEGRVNKLSQENKQLADQNQQLQQKNKELEDKNKQLANQVNQLDQQNKQLQAQNNQLQMRRPGFIAAYAQAPLPEGRFGLLDVCVWSSIPNTGGQSQPPFNPNVMVNKGFFDGDVEQPLFVPVPTTIFMYRDVAVGFKQSVYFKLTGVEFHGKDPMTPLPITAPVKISGVLVGTSPNASVDLPEVELTPEHPWILAGFLDADKTGKVLFTPATPAQREEEWRKIGKGPPPAPKP
jgi:hypothetical protein